MFSYCSYAGCCVNAGKKKKAVRIKRIVVVAKRLQGFLESIALQIDFPFYRSGLRRRLCVIKMFEAHIDKVGCGLRGICVYMVLYLGIDLGRHTGKYQNRVSTEELTTGVSLCRNIVRYNDAKSKLNQFQFRSGVDKT